MSHHDYKALQIHNILTTLYSMKQTEQIKKDIRFYERKLKEELTTIAKEGK